MCIGTATIFEEGTIVMTWRAQSATVLAMARHPKKGGPDREIDDATLPALSPVGISPSSKPTPLAWHCIELHVDGSQGVLRTWFDGAEVVGLQIDGTSTPDVDT